MSSYVPKPKRVPRPPPAPGSGQVKSVSPRHTVPAPLWSVALPSHEKRQDFQQALATDPDALAHFGQDFAEWLTGLLANTDIFVARGIKTRISAVLAPVLSSNVSVGDKTAVLVLAASLVAAVYDSLGD